MQRKKIAEASSHAKLLSVHKLPRCHNPAASELVTLLPYRNMSDEL